MLRNGWPASNGIGGRLGPEYAAKTSKIYLEYFLTAGGKRKRKRISTGHTDQKEARQQAQELAAELGRRMPEEDEPQELTLQKLFDIYLGEKTPEKSEGKQKHDRRAAKMFLAFFGAKQKPSSLKKRDGERFIRARREGQTGPVGRKPKPVGDRQVEYDLRFLLAVLNWAADNELVQNNPLQGLKLPKESSPTRPVLDGEEYLQLLETADQVDWRYRLALQLTYETGHRIESVRQLKWSDIDLERSRVLWRADSDKSDYEHETLLTPQAVEALRAAQKDRMAIGDAWVFPAPSDPSQPCSRHLMRDWWIRGVEAAGLEPVKGRGWHSMRRRFANDMKGVVPLKDLCHLGGWKNSQTILTCYQSADEETMREGLAKRKRPSQAG